jgi:hypothetical protein
MKLQPYQLTFIAEDLGKRRPPPLRWLCILSAHPSPVVREGVVYGMAAHFGDPRVRDALERMATRDENPEVRVAATEALFV